MAASDCTSRQRLRPWLRAQISSGKIPGLCWLNAEQTKFRIPWKHTGKHDWNPAHSQIFTVRIRIFNVIVIIRGVIWGGGTGTPNNFDTDFFPVNCTLIKRETVLLLKQRYVTVGLVGQTMLFKTRVKCKAAAFRFHK